MPSDSRNKWLLRLGAEGAVIVTSILLAFAIDAWWADRQEEVEETRILEALRADFDATLESVHQLRRYREAKIESITTLFEAAAGKHELDPAKLDNLLGDLLDSGTIDFAAGALDSLFEGGGLAKLQSQALRHRLTSFTYLVEWTKVQEGPEWSRQHDHWEPFFWNNTFFPQVENARGTVPGLAIESATPRIPLREMRDHSALLSDDVFLGLLTSELSTQSAQLRWYLRLEREINDVTAIIDSELAQR